MFCEITVIVATTFCGQPIVLRFLSRPNEQERICAAYFAFFCFHFSVFAVRNF